MGINSHQEAYVWFALSAAQGDEQAPGFLNKLETELTPKQIADAQKRAAERHPRLMASTERLRM